MILRTLVPTITMAAVIILDGLSYQQSYAAGNETPNRNMMPRGGINREASDISWITTRYLDLAYADLLKSQRLDLYLPNKGKGPFPLIIEIHGGGFQFGEKSQHIDPMLKGSERG